jgi:hypothetical protein
MKIRIGVLAAVSCGVAAFALMTSTYQTHIAPRYPASSGAAKQTAKVKAEDVLPANESLSVLISCHQAMTARSEGTSQMMTISNATPFVFQSGSQILFVTDESIFTVDNAKKELNGRVFQVVLPEHNVDSGYEFEVRRNGELGSVCCGDGKPTPQRTLPILNPSAKLTEDTRRALKKELAARIRSVSAQYQNKDQQMAIVPALEKCRAIDFGKKDLVGDLIARYSGQGSRSDYSTGAKNKAAH